MSTSNSTRWCPTPEQLMILEELYRRGLKTPNSSQIQKITAHLSFYGKIQGKNVFYWFQNHKARDRQKLRKKLHQHHLLQHHLYQYKLEPQTQYNHIPHFQSPSPIHQLSNAYCAQNLHAQGIGIPEEAPVGVMRTDLPKDCLIRTYGHDSIMIMDVGHTWNKPLQTLELFPLRSPTANHTQTTS